MSEKQRCGGHGYTYTKKGETCGLDVVGKKPCPGCPDCNPEVGFKEIAEAIFDPQPPPTPPDIPQGDIQEHLEGLRNSIDILSHIPPEKARELIPLISKTAIRAKETHLQAVQRWVGRAQKTTIFKLIDIFDKQEAEIAILRGENTRLRTEGVSLSNQREMAVAETREHKATIARLREEVEGLQAQRDHICQQFDKQCAERDTYRGALEGVRREIDLFIQEEASQAGRVAGSVIRKRLMPYLSPEKKPKGEHNPNMQDFHVMSYYDHYLNPQPPGEVCGTCGGEKKIHGHACPECSPKYGRGESLICPTCTPGKEGGEW